jgi:hypothetical protein
MTTLGSNNFSGYDYGQYYNQGNHDWSNPNPMIGRGYMSDYISRVNSEKPLDPTLNNYPYDNTKHLHPRDHTRTHTDYPNYGGGQGGSGPAFVPEFAPQHPAPQLSPDNIFYDDPVTPVAPIGYQLYKQGIKVRPGVAGVQAENSLDGYLQKEENREMKTNLNHIRTDLAAIGIAVFALFLINAGALTYMLILGG